MVLDARRLGHRADDALALGDRLEGARRGRGRFDALALLDVKDGVVTEQRCPSSLGGVGLLVRAALLLASLPLRSGLVPAPENHGCSLASLADGPTALGRLAIGEPVRRGKRHRRKKEDIDPAVRLATGDVARLTGIGAPRLAPRD